MTDPTVSAIIAVFAGFVLAGVLAVPYIAASYRLLRGAENAEE